MGRFFSDAVETALQCIYYDLGAGRGQEGFRLLEEASAAGDGDADCLLARCLYGPEYTWPGHRFPTDEARGDALMRRAVRRGSAIAALIAMRCGVMDDELQEAMPFASLREAFDDVLGKAEQGEHFCEMVIGNVYYWWDFLRIEDKAPEDFPSGDDFRAYLRDNALRCEDWFWKAFRGGISAGGINLVLLYTEGEKDLIPPRPEKEIEVERCGAERGYPPWQYLYACDLFEAGRREEASLLFRKAADAGEPRAFYNAGYLYEQGIGVPQDYARAAEYYVRALDAPSASPAPAAAHLGMLAYSGFGVPKDYDRAFQLLQWADRMGNQMGVFYLGLCYTYGHGTPQDYARARECLEAFPGDDPDKCYLLGWMYCRGLGGPEDIPRGVALLQKAGDYPEAKEELSHYRKTLFTRQWVRR